MKWFAADACNADARALLRTVVDLRAEARWHPMPRVPQWQQSGPLFPESVKPQSPPELISPLLQQKPTSYVVDGEAVAMQGQVSNFETLQRRGIERVPSSITFDILLLDGTRLTNLPLTERKEILRK